VLDKNLGENIVDAPTLECHAGSRRSWSLLDIMNQFASWDFYLAFYNLQAARTEAERRVKDQPCGDLSQQELAQLIGTVSRFKEQSFALGLPTSNTQVTAALMHLSSPMTDRGMSAIAVRLSVVENAAREDLGRRRFLWVNPAYNEYVDNAALFGAAVHTNFPSAQFEIKEAGNCIAAECATAVVFHLMRAAEHGLRALAFDRGITVARGPLVLATWDEIIKKLEDAENAIIGFPKTVIREEQLKFYHGANAEFRGFKNEFRNGIMHCRDEYNIPQAVGVLSRVRTFFQILAEKIAEGTKTPEMWI